MNKAEIKAAILECVSAELDQWLDKQEKIRSGYEYEREFMKVAQRVNKLMLEKSHGQLPGSRKKKRLHTCFGKIAVSKAHALCQHTHHFGISSKLQEVLCLLGQAYVFEESEDILAQLPGITLSAKQIQRVSEHYGQALEDQQQHYQQEKKEPPVLKLKSPQEPVYVMMDGSMVFTREEGWKEMKVGRLFNQSTCPPYRSTVIRSYSLCMCVI